MNDSYDKIDFWTKALRIRMIEEEIAREYKNQEMRCPVHLSIGQEANAVAITECLLSDDFMVSTHRGHAHYLAKGGHVNGLIAELYGKSGGYARGHGGSMHCLSTDEGFVGATSIVGGTVPIGVGVAFASKIRKENKITAICFGDATIEEGVFHEAANFASLHSLPAIFFMENNNYSCFTARKLRQPKRGDGFKSVADGHGMDFCRLSWDKFSRDFIFMKKKIERIRRGTAFGPLFVECDAYRFVEHCGPNSDDNLNYRPQDEVLHFTRLDPVRALKRELKESLFLTEQMEDIIEGRIMNEIKAAFHAAREALPPQPADVLYA